MSKAIRNKLIEALKPLGYKVSLQGSYSLDKKIPDSFITYFIASSTVIANYNNKPYRIGHNIDVNFYSKKMSLIETEPDKIFNLLTEAGFTVSEPGYDAGLDKDTGHYGLLMSFYFIEERSF